MESCDFSLSNQTFPNYSLRVFKAAWERQGTAGPGVCLPAHSSPQGPQGLFCLPVPLNTYLFR